MTSGAFRLLGYRVGILLLLLFAAAIGIAYSRQSSSSEQSVRGVVLEVQSQSIGLPDSFRVRDNAGREWRFRADPSILTDPAHPMNAAHLRQHSAFGDPVTVYYRENGGTLTAFRIVD